MNANTLDVAELARMEGEARYRLMADSTSDAIVTLSLDLERTYVSPAFHRLFGYQPEEVIGQLMTAIVHLDDVEELHKQIGPLILGEIDRTQLTYRVRHKQGHWIWTEGYVSLIRQPSTGRPTSMICSVRDISERHAQAEELRRTNIEMEQLTHELTLARDQAERASRDRSRFLAGISHELRTPLNGVLGYAQLLRMEGGLNQTQGARVDAMLEAGTHLLEMINCVLDLSQIEAERLELHPSKIDPHATATACLDLVRPMADAKRLTLRLVASPDVPRRIFADPTRLRQILLNLLANAVKFTAQGVVELRMRVDGARLRIDVADTGPGISPERRELLFQEFARLGVGETSMVEGAGLGLALSARLAALMGGSLGYADNPGGGSLFRLELPLMARSTQALLVSLPNPAVKTAQENAAAQTAPARPWHVLVVDDVAMNRDIAASFLRCAGQEVVCVEDGAEAVEAVRTGDFDVVLMDVRMPGMDGLEATRRIRAFPGPRGRVPIVALTAQVFAEQIEECRRAGMDRHLAKPFTPDTLLAAVSYAIAPTTGSPKAFAK